MSGNKGEYRIVRIVFPRFYTCRGYDIIDVNDKEVEWLVVNDFHVRNIDADWDELKIEIRLSLSRVYDGYKISELVTESTFHVSAGMSFEEKYFMLTTLLDETINHAQGAWIVKNTNPCIKKKLPQAYNYYKREEKEFRKRVYEIWV